MGEQTLAELFAFVRSHLLPAVAHPASPVSAGAWPAARSSEQDLAQDQDAERLPKGDRAQSEQRRSSASPWSSTRFRMKWKRRRRSRWITSEMLRFCAARCWLGSLATLSTSSIYLCRRTGWPDILSEPKFFVGSADGPWIAGTGGGGKPGGGAPICNRTYNLWKSSRRVRVGKSD